MSYATQADLVDRYGEVELVQLSDRAGLGVIDATVIGQALLDADAEIDGYLAGRYALPLASVPLVLRNLACVITLHNLYRGAVSDRVRQLYEDARRYLEGVAAGRIGLGVDADGAVQASTDLPAFSSSTGVFGRGEDF